jgi:hypothetical protein
MRVLKISSGKNWWLPWLIAGLIIRVLLMLFTAHPDMTNMGLAGYLISQKGELFTFYDHISKLPQSDPLFKIYGPTFFNYPPLAYIFPSVFMALLKPFYNFESLKIFIIGMDKLFGNSEIFRITFLLKVPLLVVDIIFAFTLLKLLEEKGRLAFKIWMFNPLTLYASFMVGQFDLLPTILVALSIIYAIKGNKVVSVLLLGIGGAFKMFPLMFLPINVLLMEKYFWKRIKLMVIGVLPYLAFVAPYALMSPMYRQAALLTHQTDKMLYMKLNLSGAEYLSVFLLGYFLILFFSAKKMFAIDSAWKFGFAFMLLFFSVTHYHPQWFLWITPFILLDFVTFGRRHVWELFGLFVCWILLTVFFESSLHVGLFASLFPQLKMAKSLSDTFPPDTGFLIKSIVRTFAASISLYLVISLFTPSLKKQ